MTTPAEVLILGLPVRLTRRRYGRQTFTWAALVLPDGSTADLGDPWPRLNPKRRELETAVREVAPKHGLTVRT